MFTLYLNTCFHHIWRFVYPMLEDICAICLETSFKYVQNHVSTMFKDISTSCLITYFCIVWYMCTQYCHIDIRPAMRSFALFSKNCKLWLSVTEYVCMSVNFLFFKVITHLKMNLEICNMQRVLDRLMNQVEVEAQRAQIQFKKEPK